MAALLARGEMHQGSEFTDRSVIDTIFHGVIHGLEANPPTEFPTCIPLGKAHG
ncbi:hypothetical protein BD324DRAFT_622317 [Kockovaella imperatae]|uniref:Uncharacterized protein n=1 Tax=Kockovaella imperatae TaxID=4999 RepID=A0A1Y1UHK7_9TREE|nr:hypothetical protein BD324DRAFT_622317 [Kockovaella imperatae]ORX37543.1 hypothetical protein BD324DRAFT_622317 [Kockovaella imperatae]